MNWLDIMPGWKFRMPTTIEERGNVIFADWNKKETGAPLMTITVSKESPIVSLTTFKYFASTKELQEYLS